MSVYNSITELVGRTPLLRLKKLEEKIHSLAKIYAKLEYYNPSGSVKARIALNMIEEKEKAGELVPGGTIIEGTSGNTGIGIAAIGAAKGYKVIICMPENMSRERKILLESYGATVRLSPADKSMGGAGELAQELASKTPGAVILGQGGNPNNPGAHYKTTGPEIWDDLDGHVDLFVASTGTGGTISGAGLFLKEKNPELKIFAVEPLSANILNGGEWHPHKIQGIGGNATPPVTNRELFDEVIDISDDDAYEYARLLPKLEGLSVGISAGAALAAVKDVATREESKDKNLVVIIPDSADHYLSSDLFDPGN